MNKLIITFCLLSFLSVQSQVMRKGQVVEFNTTITGDFARNFSGGLQQGSAYLGNIDITATLITENAKLWKGGTFFAYFLNNHGNSLSRYVGDLQGVDNIEADPNSRIYQLWYKQEFNNLTITIGQHDLNSEFCVSEYGRTFINSSFGIQPDISANILVSIFPVANLGVILKYDIKNFSILAAVYDGNPGDQISNPNSFDYNWDQTEGTTNILEIQYLKEKNNVTQRTYKVGTLIHTADSHYGIYAIVDQKLMRENIDKNQGLGFFTQLGISPDDNSYISYYVSFGLHYTGLIKGRGEDNLGLAIGNAVLSDNFINKNSTDKLRGETVIELTYKVQINDVFSIQPDLQYVIKPGGTSSVENAFTGILRLVAEF